MSPAPSTTIYLTRHGVSEHNTNTAYYMGRSPDSRLTAQGQEQARSLGRRLARLGGVDRIVASSLPRTLETAERVAAECGAVRVEGEQGFWELSKGEWEGSMPRNGVPAEIAAAIQADPFGFRYPGGESYRDVVARAAPALDAWVQRSAGQRVLFVLHGDVIRAVLYHLLRFPSDAIRDAAIFPCSLSEFLHEPGRYRMVRYNDDNHLVQDGLASERALGF